jgi:hypothetical protein
MYELMPVLPLAEPTKNINNYISNLWEKLLTNLEKKTSLASNTFAWRKLGLYTSKSI